MPSPILHTAAAASVARLGLRERFTWRDAALFAALANLPDVDFIPGLLAGEPLRHHHGITHSLAFAAAASAGAFLALKRRVPWAWLLPLRQYAIARSSKTPTGNTAHTRIWKSRSSNAQTRLR